jgi:hypothetical protein
MKQSAFSLLTIGRKKKFGFYMHKLPILTIFCAHYVLGWNESCAEGNWEKSISKMLQGNHAGMIV